MNQPNIEQFAQWFGSALTRLKTLQYETGQMIEELKTLGRQYGIAQASTIVVHAPTVTRSVVTRSRRARRGNVTPIVQGQNRKTA